MKPRIPFIFAILIVVVGTQAAIDQIWLSPTNVTALMDAGSVHLPDYADAPKGVWTDIPTGISSRVNGPLVEIDSKGLIWVISGFDSIYYMNTVWNYDPKTDLYRWVAGNVDTPLSDYLVYGEFGIPSADAFPGGEVGYAASTIDRDDNIWLYGSGYGVIFDFWRFNTTSFEFTYFGLMNSSSNGLAIMVTDKGIPSPQNYPGYVEGGILALDSKNNLWLVGGYNNLGHATNAIWHFNTTSFEWTWMWGSFSATEYLDYENNIWNGRWDAGGFIDSDDRIWVFGGWGMNAAGDEGEWGDLWSFDTKTLQWRVEWGSMNSYIINSTVVSSDYDPGNIPSGRVGAQLVDRLDGTLMIVGGVQYNAGLNLNDIWLYNKTSKMWKMVYGEMVGGDYPSNYTNYRQVGGQMGSRVYYGSPSGPNTNGNYIMYGGASSLTPLNDIWVIPQDPCAICDKNADCNSVDIWSNACTCKQGYSGNGRVCIADAVPVAVPSAVPADTNGPITNNVPVAQTPQSKSISGASTLASVGLSTLMSIAVLSL